MKEKLSTKKLRAGKKRLKDYGKVLLAKQLLRALYNNPRERTFKKYFLNSPKDPARSKASLNLWLRARGASERLVSPKLSTRSGFIFSEQRSLNNRLDIVLTALGESVGGAVSSKHAQQLINHGKITVNGHVIKERGYLLQDGDILASNALEGLSSNQLDLPALDLNQRLRSTAGSLNNVALSGLNKGHGELNSPAARLSKEYYLRNRLADQVACLKPAKIPSHLGLKTPVFANLLVNPDLKCGIYYSKPLAVGESFGQDSAEEIGDSPVGLLASNLTGPSGNRIAEGQSFIASAQRTNDQRGFQGEGWKNTNVKIVKSLLLDLKLAVSEAQSDVDNKTKLQAKKKIKSIYAVLYSLVQAYYSRLY